MSKKSSSSASSSTDDDSGSAFSQQNNEDEEALFTAVKDGDLKTIEDLISSGKVDVNCREVYSGDSPAHMACSKGQIESLKKLIDLGAKLNVFNGEDKDEESLLHCAAGKCDPVSIEIFQLIVDLQGPQVLQEKAKGNETLVYAATWAGNEELLKWLLSHGCFNQLNTQDDSGMTPLMCATFDTKKTACLDILLNAGADPSIKDFENGKSVLHYGYDNPVALEKLLDSGKCVMILEEKDNDGKTALDHAIEDERRAIHDQADLYELDEILELNKIVKMLKAACGN